MFHRDSFSTKSFSTISWRFDRLPEVVAQLTGGGDDDEVLDILRRGRSDTVRRNNQAAVALIVSLIASGVIR